MSQPVTSAESYRVATGWEADFHRWATAMLRDCARYAGYLGGGVFGPPYEGGDWHVIQRWVEPRDLARWEESATRVRWLQEAHSFARPTRSQRPDATAARSVPVGYGRKPAAAPMRRAPPQRGPTGTYHRYSGRSPARTNRPGTRDEPPAEDSAPSDPPDPPPGPPPSPPPKWKMAIITLMAVFPPVLAFNVMVIPRLLDLPVVLRTLVLCVGVTIVVTWVMMPRLQKLFRGFLQPATRTGTARRRSPPRSRNYR